MRVGIKGKLIVSFSSMLLLPVLVVLFTSHQAQSVVDLSTIIPLMLAMLIPFGIGALITGWIISKHILKPLHELDNATQRIREGNFDFAVSYHENDEIGDLCNAFNSMKEQLKDSLLKQAALETARKELIASISHDLRTPMSSIKGYVEGLQDGIIQDKEKFHRYIAVIKNKTENLDHLIEALFQYSQLDMKDSEQVFHVHDSRQWLETVITPIRMEFADNPIQLKVARPFPQVDICINANEMTQVFDNLLSNASRYVSKDGDGVITIETSVDKGQLKIAISDNGRGIAPDELPYVFDQFYRTEKSRSRDSGGAGLGLAICKKIVEKHEGKIWAESRLEIGTTFYFTLPAQSQN